MAQRIFFFAFLLCLSMSVIAGQNAVFSNTFAGKAHNTADFNLSQNAVFSNTFAGKAHNTADFNLNQNAVFSNAFAGGLNAAHFASLDVNSDGRDDLIAYDRVAVTVSVFLRNEYGEYIYCADCASALPPLRSFVQTVDMNGDGLKDIATFNGVSGINIYLNLSNDTLKFGKPITLMAFMYGSVGPLYCTSVDFPVFADIDGDGLIDVLNFWVASTGDYLLYYRNTDSARFEVADWSWGCFSEGKEDNAITLNDCAEISASTAMATSKHTGSTLFGVRTQQGLFDLIAGDVGNTDSARFEVADWSWGCFSEGKEDNAITLNDCAEMSASTAMATSKHTGSTLFGVRTQQGLFDLIVGDVGYTGLYCLHNGGTADRSRIISYDSIKTSFEFPVVSSVMFDDTAYWIVSPFTSHPFNTIGEQSVLRINPITRTVVQTDFLQNTMFDFGILSHPCTAGKNLFVGSYDNGIALIENVAVQTESTELTSVTKNLWNLKERLNSKALSPAYNSDTRELFVGMENGRVALVKDSTITDTFFANIQMGGFAAPTLFDLDNNGFRDMIIGEKRSGYLYCYYNENGIFNTVADTLKGVDVRDFNYSNFGYGVPAFYRDEQNEPVLLCGSEQGIIYEYKRDVSGIFKRTAEYNLNTGKFVAPSIMEENGEQFIIAGNIRGGLQYFSLDNILLASNESSIKTPQYETPKQILKIFSNPVTNGILNILSQEKVQYHIYDLQGKIQQSGTLTKGENTIKLRNTVSGLYLLYFRTHSIAYPAAGTVKFIVD